MKVGNGDRSAPKHYVTDKLAGQQAGVYPYVRARQGMGRFVVIDPTAGDGADVRGTPALLRRHVSFVEAKGLEAVHLMYERDADTHEALTMAGYSAMNADAIEEVPRLDRYESDCLTYVDDPNHSGASTLTVEVVEWLFAGPFVTIFASIGANASGIARRPHHYEESFDRYERLVMMADRARPYTREPVLCRLVGDSHRWAYLIVGSEKFADDACRWFVRAMSDVDVKQGDRMIRLHGDVFRGTQNVLGELKAMHTRRGA